MRRTVKISHHEIPPSQRQGKIDRYWSIGNRSDSSDVRTVQLAETVARPGGWRSRGQRKEGEQQRERYPIDERGEKEGRLGKAARTLIFLHSLSPGYN